MPAKRAVPGRAAAAPKAARPAGLLLDIDGVITVGGRALPGALDAVRRVQELKIPLKFVTNTTRRPRREVVRNLRRLGLTVETGDVFTPAVLARNLLAREKLTPFPVIHPALAEDFTGLGASGAEAVVVGDAGPYFTYDLLNQAFRKLIHGARFFALAKNRNFLDHDHELSLDAGPFVAALEYASAKEATVLGKPSAEFFKLAVESMFCEPARVAMIGDDAEADVGGAMAAGLQGILVRTGKYRPGQEESLSKPPTLIAGDLAAAVEMLFG